MINQLPSINNDNKDLVKSWIILAVSALAVAGLYSLPPVILRGSFFADKLPIEYIFTTALVVHVDLSVIVWMLSIGGALTSFIAARDYRSFYKTAFFLAAFGTALIAIAPFTGEASPLKNNYVPVLQNITFAFGLSFFSCGILLQVALTVLNLKYADNLTNFGSLLAAMTIIIAFICFTIAYNSYPAYEETTPVAYYESLFWGGGHILTYAFTAFMLVAWIWLGSLFFNPSDKLNKIFKACLLFNFIACLPAPLFYISGEMADVTWYFTLHMRYLGGISAAVMGIAVLYNLLYGNKIPSEVSRNVKSALVFSVILFGSGGILGFIIRDVNTIIPAHYHGSIVGMTLAFMGYVYYILPQLGFDKTNGKMASAQPYIYGIGQFMHITGLAVMGGYGALRKAPGTIQNIDTIIGKALFFSGGSLAIIGGLAFVVVVVIRLVRK